MTGCLRFRLAFALSATALLVALGAVRAAADEAEDAVKSVAVLNFIRYSTWPAPAPEPILVGVAGRSSFFHTLRATLENKPVNGHTVRVIEVKTAGEAQACHLLYLATDRVAEIQPFLASSLVTHALTLGEADRFLDLGGAVNLYLTDGHIAFEYSLDAIDRAAILVSSNLLRLGQLRGRGRRRGQP